MTAELESEVTTDTAGLIARLEQNVPSVLLGKPDAPPKTPTVRLVAMKCYGRITGSDPYALLMGKRYSVRGRKTVKDSVHWAIAMTKNVVFSLRLR